MDLSIWIICAVVAAAIIAVIVVPKLQMKASKVKVTDSLERLKVVNELRRTVLQLVGGIVVLAGLFFTWRQVAFNETSKAGERFTALTAALGSKEPAIRLNAIYELQQIAEQSPVRRRQIEDFLCFWMKTTSKSETSTDPDIRRNELTSVIQFVFGDGGRFKDNPLRQRHLDISGSDLSKMNLKNIDFSNTYLNGVKLEGADLTYADLREATLFGADLTNANLAYVQSTGMRFDKATILRKTSLQGADLDGVDLSQRVLEEVTFYGTNLQKVKLSRSKIVGLGLEGAHLAGVDLTGVDLSDARGVTELEFKSAKIDASTKPPKEFWSGHW